MVHMVSALHRAAAFWFFSIGFAVIIGVVLLSRGWLPSVLIGALHSLDVPLLLAGIVFGGTSLYRSMVPEGKSSPILAVCIALPLVALFCLAAYVNFALPFSAF